MWWAFHSFRYHPENTFWYHVGQKAKKADYLFVHKKWLAVTVWQLTDNSIGQSYNQSSTENTHPRPRLFSKSFENSFGYFPMFLTILQTWGILYFHHKVKTTGFQPVSFSLAIFSNVWCAAKVCKAGFSARGAQWVDFQSSATRANPPTLVGGCSVSWNLIRKSGNYLGSARVLDNNTLAVSEIMQNQLSDCNLSRNIIAQQ